MWNMDGLVFFEGGDDKMHVGQFLRLVTREKVKVLDLEGGEIIVVDALDIMDPFTVRDKLNVLRQIDEDEENGKTEAKRIV